ncbi:MAG: hypothetical protein O3A20_07920 [Planctomycetota bacterium]|nr:hypothetical protein [Planctomycetota bacterium]
MDPSTRSDDNFAPARRGARWREAAIVLLASAAIVWIILGTVRSELQRARMRFAEDTLAHLAGQVTLAMQRASDRGEDPRAWSFPLLGPGAEGSAVLGTPLELVLPAGSWLPRDPWGRGFRVLLAGEDPRRYPLLVCGGPDDRFDPERPDPRWSQPILWPEPPR